MRKHINNYAKAIINVMPSTMILIQMSFFMFEQSLCLNINNNYVNLVNERNDETKITMTTKSNQHLSLASKKSLSSADLSKPLILIQEQNNNEKSEDIILSSLQSSLAILAEEENQQNKHSLSTKANRTKPLVNSKMIQEELEENSWDYMTELIFILLLALFTIPANLFLFIFYKKKVRRYKLMKHLNLNYTRIANSFNTYMIEICSFDTIIVIYLVLNTSFQILHYYKKTPYESVFDISNFTCKMFIYILRISGAMSNYLVFFLSLSRSLLILYNHGPMNYVLSSRRLCLNTKYLTLFLFCVCTIANVFRLELLNINNSNSKNMNKLGFASKDFSFITDNSSLIIPGGDVQMNQAFLELLFNGSLPKAPECGPNVNSITFTINNESNALFWSIVIYNIFFTIAPSLGNLALSIYLIKKRSRLNEKLNILTDFMLRSRRHRVNIAVPYVRQSNDAKNEDEKEKFDVNYNDLHNVNNEDSNEIQSQDIHDFSIKTHYSSSPSPKSSISPMNIGTNEMGKKPFNFRLNEFHVEFLKTCTPCIAFSLAHVILFLPYSILELVNQIRPNLTFIQLLQYMTYVRYFFYCCKFYLLYLVSYKFRKDFKNFFRPSEASSSR